MKKVFLIHGYGGEPNGGWRPWLMGKLAREEVWACALAMPMIDEKPIKDEWVTEITRSVGKPDENVFLVGHSLGVPALLNYIESLPIGSRIGGVVLVSGIIHPIPGKDRYIPINHFYEKEFNYEHTKKICNNFFVIHGDNDTAVPFEQAQELSKNLSCQLIPIKNGGHLNGSSGWYELPEALEALLKMIKE
jgi:predicted alpha/beta hydrolase family esterase